MSAVPSDYRSPDGASIDSFTRGLMSFLDDSPVALIAADNIAGKLRAAGFQPLREEDAWHLVPGGRYYVLRGGSALIAFCLPAGAFRKAIAAPLASLSPEGAAGNSAELLPAAFHIAASHLDSPTFRIKSNAEITIENQYIALNVEKYGGMILSTWLDRPLSVAGRVLVRTGSGISERLVNIDRDLLIIPSVAIHMNRSVNDGYRWDMRQDLRPLLTGLQDRSRDLLADSAAPCDPAQGTSADGKNEQEPDSRLFRRLIAEAAHAAPEDLIDMDLFLCNRQKAARTGLHGEFLSCGRLDDLQCAYASLAGFLSSCSPAAAQNGAPCPSDSAASSDTLPVYCAFDSEEVGSMTRQGADSSFLRTTLRRIGAALGWTEEDFCRSIARSFLISADNAHAVHPNHPELEDPTHRPVLNGGIVIKYSANQKYTTDAVSGAIMQELCRRAGVPVQLFYNRSDLPGGSTLGNISGTQLSIRTVDIGLPQLAMHSAYETAGVLDGRDLADVCGLFFRESLPEIRSGH